MTNKFGWSFDVGLRVVIVVAWVSAISLAFPLPTKQIEFLEANTAVLRSMVFDEMRLQGEQVSDAEVTKRTVAAAKAERGRLWFQWALTSSMIVLGLIAAYFAIRAIKGWRLLALIGSSWYVAALLWTFAGGRHSIVDAYLSTASGVLKSDSALEVAKFLHTDVLLPMVHVLLAACLIVTLILEKARASHQAQ